jgi:hypothetical protein
MNYARTRPKGAYRPLAHVTVPLGTGAQIAHAAKGNRAIPLRPSAVERFLCDVDHISDCAGGMHLPYIANGPQEAIRS